MPVATKVSQKIYSWVDDSGTKHFSNVSKNEANTSTLSGANSPIPQQSQTQEKPNEQAIQPQVVKSGLEPPVVNPPPTLNPGNGNGFGVIVFMILIVVAFRMFLDRVEKGRREKKRYDKIRELRPESNPLPSQETSDIGLSETIHPELNPISPQPSWTLQFIRSLEWREFEKLCATVLETRGFHAKLGNMGADEGIDIHIYTPQQPEKPHAIAQCKAHQQEIKVDVVRAFRGVMAAKNITKGFFFTSGGFYKKADEFGKDQDMELITGDDLLTEITSLPQDKQDAMLQEISSTDYTAPTCVSCGVKMIIRASSKSENQFWGCINFPKCQNTLKPRWTDQKKSEHPIKILAKRSMNRWR